MLWLSVRTIKKVGFISTSSVYIIQAILASRIPCGILEFCIYSRPKVIASAGDILLCALVHNSLTKATRLTITLAMPRQNDLAKGVQGFGHVRLAKYSTLHYILVIH